MNTARAVREYGMAGVAGVCIEDNIFPKRCSLYGGADRELLPVADMCDKLAAARKAAAPFGMLLIGRVESLIAGLGVEDAIARANAYAEAGVDAVLIHGKNFAPVREVLVSKRLLKPVVLVPTLFPQTTFAEMQQLGVSVAIYANQLMRAMVRAGEVALERLLAAKSLSDADDLLVSLDHINKLVGVPADWRAEKPKAVAVAAAG
jgi:phosphoenolpyruvate phosphomutase